MHQNIIELKNWYAQPVHCPFCGSGLNPHESFACKHQLYLVFDGAFYYIRERFAHELNLPDGDLDSGDIVFDKNIYGSTYDILDRAHGKIPNLVEFRIDNVSDMAHAGFANLDSETVGWGLKHKSPYDDSE